MVGASSVTESDEVLKILGVDPDDLDPAVLEAFRGRLDGTNDPRALAAKVSRVGGVARSTRYGHGGVTYGTTP